MSTGVIQGNQTTISATLSFQPAGAKPAAPPVWSLTKDGVVSMTVADDGMSASFVRATDGSDQTDVNVVAEGDPTPGVDTIHLTGTIQVLAKEITSGEIDFGSAS